MKLTKEQLEKFYNSPIACAIMQGLCTNQNSLNNPKTIVATFISICANLHLETDKLLSRDN